MNCRRNSTDMYEQFCLGRVVKLDYGIVESQFNSRYPELLDACKQLIREHDSEFIFDAIQVNKNYRCARHVDRNNQGKSYIVALGDFEGGALATPDGVLDVKNKLTLFDGTKWHETLEFSGERYSLVFFAIRDSFKRARASM